MSYKDRNRKLLTLPSGAVVMIRKLLARDYLTSKEIPIMDLVGKRSKASQEEISSDNIQVSIVLAKIILTACTSQFVFGGVTYRIVDKATADCADNELSIEDLDQADADAIVAEVNSFSGWTPQAAEAAKPFLSESQNGDPYTQAGQIVSLPSDANPKSANG